MGIHTGDSITIAPADPDPPTAISRACATWPSVHDARHRQLSGGCNVQFAVSPDEKEEIVAIEINPRVSRSSSLASKARDTPSQNCDQLASAIHWTKLQNQITKTTSALFEPTLDYVIVKIPAGTSTVRKVRTAPWACR